MSGTTSEESRSKSAACGERKRASAAGPSLSPSWPAAPARVETVYRFEPSAPREGVSSRIVWFEASATAMTPAGETPTPWGEAICASSAGPSR